MAVPEFEFGRLIETFLNELNNNVPNICKRITLSLGRFEMDHITQNVDQ